MWERLILQASHQAHIYLQRNGAEKRVGLLKLAAEIRQTKDSASWKRYYDAIFVLPQCFLNCDGLIHTEDFGLCSNVCFTTYFQTTDRFSMSYFSLRQSAKKQAGPCSGSMQSDISIQMFSPSFTGPARPRLPRTDSGLLCEPGVTSHLGCHWRRWGGIRFTMDPYSDFCK